MNLSKRPHTYILFLISVLLLTLLSNSARCAEARPEVRVGFEKDFKPYSFIDEKGEPAGFGVDLIRAVAEAMDVPVSLHPVSWDAAWSGLVSGRYDALPIVARLPSRALLVDFSLPHTETFDAFFVRSSEPVIKDIPSANGRNIIVMRSDAAHHALIERGFEGRITTAENIREMLNLLASGRYDAALYPKLLGIIAIKDLGVTGINAGPTIPDYKREFSFAVKKGDAELLEKLNEGLLIVKSNGEYARIYEKWLGQEDPWLRYRKYFWPVILALATLAFAAVSGLIVLKMMVKRRTAELAEKNDLLRVAREELSARVEQRTAELSKANIALEAENAERRLAEATLKTSEERHRSYIELTGQLGWVTSAEGMVVDDLPAWRRYTGQEFEEIAGWGWSKAVHPEDLERVKAEWQSAITERGPYETEYRLRRHDGVYRHFLARGIPLIGIGGAVREWVGTCIDITERKQAEDALRRAHDELENRVRERTCELEAANLKLKHEISERARMEGELIRAQKLESLGVLAGGIAHDFNNLLQTITNALSVARTYALPGSPAVDVLRDAGTASRYASALSQKLLTFAKGGSPLKKKLSVARLIEESISLSMSGSNIVCRCSIPDGLHQVEADEGQLSQVFNNLLINARESMPEGGSISVRAINQSVGDGELPSLTSGDYVRISIEDHGTGIKAENIGRIFDPYFSTKERGAEKGTGLGLSVCHSIIKKHSGLITVESTEGSGSTFHIYLPAPERHPRVKARNERVQRSRAGRVLMMEDERQMWLSTRLIFRFMGYEIEFAVNGEEALRLFKRAIEEGRPFDGVILDLTIPGGMGGVETVRRLREIDGDVRAMVVSGYADDQVMTNFKEYGFSRALAKPYTIDELREAVLSEFGGKPALT